MSEGERQPDGTIRLPDGKIDITDALTLDGMDVAAAMEGVLAMGFQDPTVKEVDGVVSWAFRRGDVWWGYAVETATTRSVQEAVRAIALNMYESAAHIRQEGPEENV